MYEIESNFLNHAVLSMDASVTIVRSMDQSNSKEDWRANNNFTDTLKIDIRGFFKCT